MKPETLVLFMLIVAVLVGGGIYVKGFKNWLVWAVSEAERMFGSGTGQLKLRYVYDLAIKAFPTMAKFIPFTMFSKLVDNALVVMREMIENNEKIANLIEWLEEEPPAEDAETKV